MLCLQAFATAARTTEGCAHRDGGKTEELAREQRESEIAALRQNPLALNNENACQTAQGLWNAESERGKQRNRETGANRDAEDALGPVTFPVQPVWGRLTGRRGSET